MKFKVGDKVKFIRKTNSHSSDVKLGEVYTIEYIDYIYDAIPYRTKENGEWFKEDELELVKTVQFTKSDLKDGDIVIYRNGAIRTLRNKDLVDEIGITGLTLDDYTEELINKNRSIRM